jgi:hypothetical protein
VTERAVTKTFVSLSTNVVCASTQSAYDAKGVRGHRVRIVPRVLHPEFGYLGAPNFGGRLIVFAVCGLLAGIIGVNVFKGSRDPDPTSTMALAPAEALSNKAGDNPPEKGEFAQGIDPSVIKSRCQKSSSEHLPDDCPAVPRRRPRSVLPINERPPIAAVQIGHREEPTVPASEPITTSAATSEETGAGGSVNTEDVVSAPEIRPAPAVPPRIRSNHVRQHDRNQGKSAQRRYRNDYYFSSNYRNSVQTGYARLW